MNHRQLEALKAATEGHTPGPWEVRKVNSTPCVFCTQRATNLLIEGWGDRHDIHLAAAAPDLLAEVERLRDLLARLREMVDPDSDLACAIDAALDGAEVPE